jgi:hypothetical protein
MEKEFVPYTEALELKELGFDEPCLAIHSNANPKTGLYTLKKYRLKLIKQASQKDKGVKAPLYQQAFRWFREKYGICSWIERLYTDDHVLYYRYTCEKNIESPPNYNKTWVTLKEYNTYEEAEQACLDKLIEICKTKTNG